MRLEIDTKHINKYLNKVIKDDRARYNFLKRAGIEGENQLQAAAYPITVSGELGRSIGHDVISKTAVRIFADSNYAQEAMETGRKPGKMPSINALSIWAAKRGIPKGAVFPIAKKIAKSGTIRYRKSGPKLVTLAIQRIQDKIMRKLIPSYLELYD